MLGEAALILSLNQASERQSGEVEALPVFGILVEVATGVNG